MSEDKSYSKEINDLHSFGKDIADKITPALLRFVGIKKDKANGTVNMMGGTTVLAGAGLVGGGLAVFGSGIGAGILAAIPFWAAGVYVATQLTPIGTGMIQKGAQQSGLAHLARTSFKRMSAVSAQVKSGWTRKAIAKDFNKQAPPSVAAPAAPKPDAEAKPGI